MDHAGPAYVTPTRTPARETRASVTLSFRTVNRIVSPPFGRLSVFGSTTFNFLAPDLRRPATRISRLVFLSLPSVPQPRLVRSSNHRSTTICSPIFQFSKKKKRRRIRAESQVRVPDGRLRNGVDSFDQVTLSRAITTATHTKHTRTHVKENW